MDPETTEKLSPKEQLIRAKMAAGLSRDQAIEVIAAQEDHDANLAEQEAAAAKKAKAAKGKGKEGETDPAPEGGDKK